MAESVVAGPRPRRVVVALPALVVAGLALVVAVLVSLAVGSNLVPLPELLAAARGHGDPYVQTLLDARVPRTLTGLLAGAALAIAGTCAQVATRNALADPGILGITTGASAGIVTVTSAATGLADGSAAGGLGLIGGALLGAVAATVAVMALGAAGRETEGTRLLLGGAVVTAVTLAYSQATALRSPAAFEALRYWSAGSLAGSAGVPVLMLVAVLVAAAGAFLAGRALDALALGDETASTLGHRPALTRAVVLLLVALLAAAATALTGPIAFVGLAVPHIARTLVGAGTLRQLTAGALIGPAVLLLADSLGRVVARPGEVPVGVVTAVLGAPLLLVLLHRRSSR